MINSKQLEPLIGLFLSVTVPHKLGSGKTFRHFGWLRSIDNDTVTLETEKGEIIIERLDHILEVKSLKQEGSDDRR